VDEYIRSVFTADESVALRVVKPLDLSFVLRHKILLSLNLFGLAASEVNRIHPPI
jgi:hypothetical protein